MKGKRQMWSIWQHKKYILDCRASLVDSTLKKKTIKMETFGKKVIKIDRIMRVADILQVYCNAVRPQVRVYAF